MALKYPETIDGSKDFVKFQFYDYSSPFQATQSDGAEVNTNRGKATAYQSNQTYAKKGDPIYLLMPQEIVSNFTGGWGGKDVTSVAQFALGSVGNIAGSIVKGNPGQAIQNIINLFDGDTIKNGLGAGLSDSLRFFGGEFSQLPGMGANLSANDLLQLTTESIINPNTELLYGGTGLRTHAYSFKMIAQSSTEAQNILDIVEAFKKACAPKAFSPIFKKTFKNFIGIPDLCQITFCGPGGNENNNLPKYKISGITSVNVNYVTEGQYISYTDGKPLGVILSVGLTETKLVFSEDIGSVAR